MAISFSSILATVTDPLLLAGTVIIAGFFGARYGRMGAGWCTLSSSFWCL